MCIYIYAHNTYLYVYMYIYIYMIYGYLGGEGNKNELHLGSCFQKPCHVYEWDQQQMKLDQILRESMLFLIESRPVAFLEKARLATAHGLQ